MCNPGLANGTINCSRTWLGLFLWTILQHWTRISIWSREQWKLKKKINENFEFIFSCWQCDWNNYTESHMVQCNRQIHHYPYNTIQYQPMEPDAMVPQIVCRYMELCSVKRPSLYRWIEIRPINSASTWAAKMLYFSRVGQHLANWCSLDASSTSMKSIRNCRTVCHWQNRISLLVFQSEDDPCKF